MNFSGLLARLILIGSNLLNFDGNEQTFDYVIAGGGTAGLVVAARLSELHDVTVAVVEAGGDQRKDLSVLAPGLLSLQWNSPLHDWSYITVPQVHANNRTLSQPHGRQLGGSSAINAMGWYPAARKDLDHWVKLGITNWTWDDLFPYYLRSSRYISPPDHFDLNTSWIDPSVHGTSGPLVNSLPITHNVFVNAWTQSWDKLGLAANGDPYGGDALGAFTNLDSIDPQTNTRSFSANTYLSAAEARSNLHVITEAIVEMVVFANKRSKSGNLVAKGVTFVQNGTSKTIKARKEVILSSGAFGSPKILELSGIGNADLLTKHGIPIYLENSNVGENLQDHAMAPVGFEANDDVPTVYALSKPGVAEAALQQYLVNHTGPFTAGAAGSVYLSLKQIENLSGSSDKITKKLPSMLSTQTSNPPSRFTSQQHTLLLPSLLNPDHAAFYLASAPLGMSPSQADNMTRTYAPDPPGNYYSIIAAVNQPWSRGSVHINSTSATSPPLIDPNYLSHPLDLDLYAHALLAIQTFAASPSPLSALLKSSGTKLQPGFEKFRSLSSATTWLRANILSLHHFTGTCAMAPSPDAGAGGVVDSRLTVHGTANVCVIDASVIPMQPTGLTQAFVYALAEKGADLVKEDLLGRDGLEMHLKRKMMMEEHEGGDDGAGGGGAQPVGHDEV